MAGRRAGDVVRWAVDSIAAGGGRWTPQMIPFSPQIGSPLRELCGTWTVHVVLLALCDAVHTVRGAALF